MAKKTIYLSIEGGDGSGKTTLVKSLYAHLSENLKKKVLLTKEFGSELDKACSELRKIALNSKFNIDETAGQIIFAAIVRQHQVRVIKPTLENKTHDIILSDRGIDSNFAYGPAHGLSNKKIETIFKPAYEEASLPDVTFYLDVDPLLAASRRAKRTAEAFADNGVDRVEEKGLKLQQQVRKNFLKLAKSNPERIVVIEITPSKTPSDVLNEVIKYLKERKVL
jgi:dTMP kinase